ncbi:hypothetical protein [Xanthomonas oryzae]|uniref:hypothetical protein n=1 Tax=Xanthomonas oryzae TaxID=347 RepID=UPI001404E72A|nr:hypothetical protein [Xanthomonas oryzae]
MSPAEVDANLGLSKYKKKSQDGNSELEISFSVVMQSFQVRLRINDKEIISFSSENVIAIEIIKTDVVSGLRIKFDIQKTRSEAFIKLEPDISCDWWLIVK